MNSPEKQHKDLYRSTRGTWERIWREEANLTRELETLRYPRSLQARALYTPYMPREEMILEAGCGLGREVIWLDHRGYQVVGVDYAESALQQLNGYRRGYRVAAGDIHDLPFQNGIFGAYLSFGVLEHFEFGPEPGLAEANRVLRQGGILVLMVPYPNLIWRLVRLWRRLNVHTSRKPGFYETTYTVRELRQYLHRTGFEIIDRYPVGHSFTLWGLGGPFRDTGYYETSRLAEWLGALSLGLFPWAICFESLLIARKNAGCDGSSLRLHSSLPDLGSDTMEGR